MVETDIGELLNIERQRVDRELLRQLRVESGVPRRLADAMHHSVTAGGKRLRPILLLWTHDAVCRRANNARREAALQVGCALEMLHTYSLIHDDLPAMDDDVLRRGQPTCHVAFDEATAILAGDGLHALGFGLIARAGGKHGARLVDMVARAVGPAGMVGGQQNDLDAEGADVDGALIKKIQLGKTARLLAVAMAGGAVMGGAGEDLVKYIETAGLELGLAFQTADDVLDVTADSEQLGKTAGKDDVAQKATWIRVEGLDKAQQRARRYGRRGRRILEDHLPRSEAADRLLALSELMWNRDR